MRRATKADLDEYRKEDSAPLLCGSCWRPLRAGSILDPAFPWHVERSHHAKCPMNASPDDREHTAKQTEWWFRRAGKKAQAAFLILEKEFGSARQWKQ